MGWRGEKQETGRQEGAAGGDDRGLDERFLPPWK